MPRVLAISSQVARGHVGLSAMVPALNALGHETIALPTVVFSHHPGHKGAVGLPVAAAKLDAMATALDGNGWLSEIDAVATGYLPTREHVDFAADLIGRMRRERPVLYLCDPVLGDGRRLYIDEPAAARIRERLVPLADILTPNRFEFGWLTGRELHGLDDVVATAAMLAAGPRAGQSSGERIVAVTSAEIDGGSVVNLLVHGESRLRATVRWHDGVPHGTGDLLAALLLGHLLDGEAVAAAFARTVSGVDQVVRASAGADELQLVATLEAAAAAGSLALDPV